MSICIEGPKKFLNSLELALLKLLKNWHLLIVAWKELKLSLYKVDSIHAMAKCVIPHHWCKKESNFINFEKKISGLSKDTRNFGPQKCIDLIKMIYVHTSEKTHYQKYHQDNFECSVHFFRDPCLVPLQRLLLGYHTPPLICAHACKEGNKFYSITIQKLHFLKKFSNIFLKILNWVMSLQNHKECHLVKNRSFIDLKNE